MIYKSSFQNDASLDSCTCVFCALRCSWVLWNDFFVLIRFLKGKNITQRVTQQPASMIFRDYFPFSPIETWFLCELLWRDCIIESIFVLKINLQSTFFKMFSKCSHQKCCVHFYHFSFPIQMSLKCYKILQRIVWSFIFHCAKDVNVSF